MEIRRGSGREQAAANLVSEVSTRQWQRERPGGGVGWNVGQVESGGTTNGGGEVGPELDLDSRRRVLAVRSFDDPRDARDRA